MLLLKLVHAVSLQDSHLQFLRHIHKENLSTDAITSPEFYLWIKIFPLKYIIIILLLSACQGSIPDKMATFSSTETDQYYVFLGHICDNQRGDKVDKRIENLNLEQFNEIWLGGDLCVETTRKHKTVRYLDKLFNLGAPTTHWATGNHDVRDGHPEWIESRTGRPLYYSSHRTGITKIVMNTNIIDPQFDDCDYIDGQLQMIRNVLDSIDQSSHLVLLMHYVLWLDCENGMQTKSAENANASWISMSCDKGNQFQHAIYPKLIEIQKGGTQVIVVSGDCGQYGKRYTYQTSEGIQFYMSGINNSFDMTDPVLQSKFNADPDSILVFHHDLKRKKLIGQFYELNDL